MPSDTSALSDTPEPGLPDTKLRDLKPDFVTLSDNVWQNGRMMLVRERLQQLIRENALRQDHLAERMGKNPRWLSNRLHGVVSIKADEVPMLAAALGVQPRDLFETGDDPLLDELSLLLTRVDRLTKEQRDFVHMMAGRLADRTRPELATNGV